MLMNELEGKTAAVTCCPRSSERRSLVQVESIIVTALFLICALSIAVTKTAAADEEGDYWYTVSDGAATIWRYVGDGGDILIPSTLGGYPVVAIGHEAFISTAVTSVTIPDSVTSIGDEAFAGCGALTSVTIPNSITYIGYGAFWDCTSLTSVAIPSSVTYIGDRAFYHCLALTAIEVDDGNPSYASVDGVLYDKDIITLIQCPPGKAGAVTIPSSVTYIGGDAFQYCTVLTAIEVDDGNPSYASVDGVLYDKDIFTLIRCPAGRAGALTIADGAINIGDRAFHACSLLTSVTIPDSVIFIGGQAFRSCTGLTSVIIPDSVTFIGSYSFSLCANLASVTIGCGVTVIDYHAFDRCSALTSVTIPDNVITLEYGVFFRCTALASVTIGKGVTDIGASAFDSCSALTSVTIPDNVKTLGNAAFIGCDALTSVTIGNGITSIEANTFAYCIALKSVTIPDSVIFIGINAFGFCTGLTSVTIPNSVTTLGEVAFVHCSALESVTIGSGVTTIEGLAFRDCSALALMTFLGLTAPTTVGSDWIAGTAPGIQGHAYLNSNFPATGNYFHGLLMGVPIGFALNLVEGWNFVTVPPIGYGYKASTLGGIVDQVAGWDPLTKQYTVWWSMFPEENDFAIEGSTGYWILPKAPGTLALDGYMPDAPQSRTINVPSGGGWAIVGFNSLNTTWNASDIVGMYTDGAVYQVATWDPVAKAYAVWWSMFPEENDFSLVPGQGYWVYFTASGTLTYTP